MEFNNIFKRMFSGRQELRDVPVEQNATAVPFCNFYISSNPDTLSAFFAARELISNSIAQLPIHVKYEGEIIKNNRTKLFYNTLQSKFNLFKEIVQDMIDWGDALCYIERAQDGTPTQLIYYPHGTWQAFYHEPTRRLFYRINGITSDIEPKDVLHFFKNNNNTGVMGRSICSYASKITSLASATDKAASNYYSSGCAINGVLTLKGSRRNSKEAAREAFTAVHSGSNSSGIVILDDETTYQPLSSNANESQMLETRLFNISEIARFFNINPVLLGDLSKSSYNTIEAANIEFVSHTLMPYISLIECELNRKLFRESEEGYVFDIDETYLIKGDKNSTATYYKTLVDSGIITRNEARRGLGLNPLDGLDDIVIPYTNIADNTIHQSDNKESDEQES